MSMTSINTTGPIWTTTAPNTVDPNTVDTGQSWTTWTTPNTGGIWYPPTPDHTNYGRLTCDDLDLKGLGSVRELLANMGFLIPPIGLDIDNPAVADAVNTWYRALEQLRQAHAELQTIVTLTQDAGK